jgi:hypothetical protein
MTENDKVEEFQSTANILVTGPYREFLETLADDPSTALTWGDEEELLLAQIIVLMREGERVLNDLRRMGKSSSEKI